jgi:hypothetical protein
MKAGGQRSPTRITNISDLPGHKIAQKDAPMAIILTQRVPGGLRSTLKVPKATQAKTVHSMLVREGDEFR